MSNDDKWFRTFGNNVRFATLTDNMASESLFNVIHAHEINKEEKDVWLVYPGKV